MRKLVIVAAFLLYGATASAQDRSWVPPPAPTGPGQPGQAIDLGGTITRDLKPARASCRRWLYNPSGYTWKITPPSGSAMCSNEPGACLAHPYMGAPIFYDANAGGKFRLQAFIADKMDVSKPQTIVADYELEIVEEEPKGWNALNPKGNPCSKFKGQDPAGVSLNEPSQGDIVVCGSGSDKAETWNAKYTRQPCKFSVHEPTMVEISNEKFTTPGMNMRICADRTKQDEVTFAKDHCKAHGGECRIGCDIH